MHNERSRVRYQKVLLSNEVIRTYGSMVSCFGTKVEHRRALVIEMNKGIPASELIGDFTFVNYNPVFNGDVMRDSFPRFVERIGEARG